MAGFTAKIDYFGQEVVDEEKDFWAIVFRYENDGLEWEYSADPEDRTRAAWEELADAPPDLDQSGIPDLGIYVSGGKYHITCRPPACVSGTYASMVLPMKVVQPALQKVMAEAKARGLGFREKPYEGERK